MAVFDRAKNVRLFDHLGLEKEPTEDIVLIFNDKHVWYPLMERDDAKKDANLRALATAYTQDYGFDSQPYAVFLNKINRRELKIKQWK